MLISSSLVAILAVIAIYFYKKYYRKIKLARQFSGPPTLPIIGNALSLIGIPADEAAAKVWKFCYDYGTDGILKLWLGPELNFIMSNLKGIEEVLGRSVHIDKASEYHILEKWMGEGLLTSKSKKWFQRRKIITPAFHFQILEQFVDSFYHQGNAFVNMLKKEMKMCDKLELYNYINLVTLDVICESAMGVSVNAQTNSDSQYVRASRTMSKVLHKRMFDIQYRFDFIFKFTKLAQEEREALKIIHDFSEKVILNRREELMKASANPATTENQNDVGSKRKMAFLDILLQSEIEGKPLSNLDIREEVDTFMFEGHDTTSSAILFFFYNIATNPKAQQKCYEEILDVLGSDKMKPIRMEDINNLQYIELCVKETLRLFPPVPILGRKINEECEINGKRVPAGTNIGISPLQLGRLEEIFPNANDFIPERFDVVTSAEKMNPYAYIPFSAGPRNCIGQKFAMLEIKSIVANVMRNFEIEYCGDAEPILIAELILKTRDPLMFKIKERI